MMSDTQQLKVERLCYITLTLILLHFILLTNAEKRKKA